MANEVLCKRFTIQSIINPGKFCAIEYGKEGQNNTKRHLSSKNVKEFGNLKEIYIGQIVAVKHENEFHKGLVTDIYNRQLKPTYYVWLIIKGINIEASAESIFLIRTSEMRSKKINEFEIVVHGIQPVTLELFIGSVNLDCHMSRNSPGSILHKRQSNEWSPAAFKFIKDLFKTDKSIYVKWIDIKGSTITGDVYYKQEGDAELTSLAQILCDKDFAVLSQKQSKDKLLCDFQGNEYFNIERKIPDVHKNVDWEELSVMNPDHMETANKLSLSSTASYSRSSYSGSDKFSKDSENKTKSLVISSGFSPSWILKKMAKISLSTSSESFKSSCQQIDQSEKTQSDPKVSLFRIVQRNVQLNDMQKPNI